MLPFNTDYDRLRPLAGFELGSSFSDGGLLSILSSFILEFKLLISSRSSNSWLLWSWLSGSDISEHGVCKALELLCYKRPPNPPENGVTATSEEFFEIAALFRTSGVGVELFCWLGGAVSNVFFLPFEFWERILLSSSLFGVFYELLLAFSLIIKLVNLDYWLDWE